jgi:hypothetical protein
MKVEEISHKIRVPEGDDLIPEVREIERRRRKRHVWVGSALAGLAIAGVLSASVVIGHGDSPTAQARGHAPPPPGTVVVSARVHGGTCPRPEGGLGSPIQVLGVYLLTKQQAMRTFGITIGKVSADARWKMCDVTGPSVMPGNVHFAIWLYIPDRWGIGSALRGNPSAPFRILVL